MSSEESWVQDLKLCSGTAVILGLALLGLSCAHVPKGPYVDVSYSKSGGKRVSTNLLGEITIVKGNKYFYRISGIPEGQFSIGIFFNVKQGPQWFPDNWFPVDATVKLMVLEDQKRLFALSSPLSDWLQVPWGPNLNDRGLIAPLPFQVNEVERWMPTLGYKQGNLVTYKDNDYVNYSNGDLCPPFVNSKSGKSYVVILTVLKSDTRSDRLIAYAGIEYNEKPGSP